MLCYYVIVVENPGNWDPMPQDVVCHVVALNSSTPEYDKVKDKFEIIMKKHKIVKIERIQHPFLHAQYVTWKKKMNLQNPLTMNERELFHGCPGDVAVKIIHQGFNRSFAGKNGMLLYKNYVIFALL